MYACYVSKGTGWMSWEGKIVTNGQDRKIRIFGINLLTRDILVIKVNSNNKPRLPSHESTDK